MIDSQLTLPESGVDVTVGWLNTVLERSAAWKHGLVVSANLEQIGGIDSLASSVFRARIYLESGQESSLLVKMQMDQPRPALIAMYEAESYFYNRYADRAGIPTPDTYFAAFDQDSNRFIIVQEFLTEGEVGTSGAFLSWSDLLRAVINLADMHSNWWASDELMDDPKVRRMQDLVARSNATLQDPESNPVPGFLRDFEDRLVPGMVRFFETMPEWRPRLASMPWPPDTLIHADCSSKNTMFPFDAARSPVLLDWALFHRGPGAYDLAVLISASASPAHQVDTLRLLEAYLERLSSNGVQSYEFSALKTDYVRSLIFRSYGLPLVASWGTPEGSAHLDSVISSMGAALENSGAFELASELTR